MADTTCRAPGCIKDRKRGATLCSMHRARLSRTGSLDLLPRTKPYAVSTSGYRIASKDYEHRVVLKAVIGEAPHPCHWCNRMLAWGVDLHVDHLDHDKLNNDPHNLVPSCQPCNNRRARHWAHGRTHCRRGHEYNARDTRLDARGHRICKPCHRISTRRYDDGKKKPPSTLVADRLNRFKALGGDWPALTTVTIEWGITRVQARNFLRKHGVKLPDGRSVSPTRGRWDNERLDA